MGVGGEGYTSLDSIHSIHIHILHSAPRPASFLSSHLAHISDFRSYEHTQEAGPCFTRLMWPDVGYLWSLGTLLSLNSTSGVRPRHQAAAVQTVARLSHAR